MAQAVRLVTLAAVIVLAGSADASCQTVTVDAGMSNQTLEGWGTSLAWFANATGGWTDKANQKRLMEALFSRTTGLGLTYLRYNIGGGDDPRCGTPQHTACIEPAYHATPGYLASDRAGYDWTQDANQRRVAAAAQSYGADLFEAISYSPPYWMTISGTSKGGVNGAPNLAAEYYGSGPGTFADYLTTVTQHFATSFGITFHHVDPQNEPGQKWWVATDTKQEGCGFDLVGQERIIQDTAASLSARHAIAEVSAMDENEEGSGTAAPHTTAGEFYRYDAATHAAMTSLNAHGYSSPLGSVAVATLARHFGKRVTLSEWGTSDTTGRDLSNQILADIYSTRATAWAIWQPDYPALMSIDYAHQDFTLNQAYYVFENYTRFIRPGFQFLAVTDSQSLAAFCQRCHTLVMVAQNWTAASRDVNYRLKNFTHLSSRAAIYQTSSVEHFSTLGSVPVHGDSLSYALPPGSVTTFVLSGVSYDPPATSVTDQSSANGSSHFTYRGGWTDSGSQQQRISSSRGSEYTVTFTGQQTRVYAPMTPDSGIAAFSIDHGGETYVDCYAPHRTGSEMLFATETLGHGMHTLTVRVTGLRNPASTGTHLYADRVDVVAGDEVGQGISTPASPRKSRMVDAGNKPPVSAGP